MTVEHGDLVLLHQAADAGGKLARDLARALDDLGDVEFRILDREAVLVEMLEQLPDLRGAQQRLRRNTAPVEADAAEMLALDDGGLERELRGTDRRDIA